MNFQLKAFSALTNRVKDVAGINALRVQKRSPEILIGLGITGFVGTVVLASRATLKCESVMAGHHAKMKSVEHAYTNAEVEEYTEKDYNRDLLVVNVQTGVDFARLYAPTIALGTVSIACILSAHNILHKRNVALAAAYQLVQYSFVEYRDRVREELGAEKDFHFRYGTNEKKVTETTVDPKTGKKNKVKKVAQALNPDVDMSMYARLFEPVEYQDDEHKIWTGSTQFSPTHDYNYAYLVGKLNWVNDRLNAQGYLFLSDVYDELGFARNKASQVVGWVKGNGDGYVSFGEALDLISHEDGDPILLDFNVDGPILDLI